MLGFCVSLLFVQIRYFGYLGSISIKVGSILSFSIVMIFTLVLLILISKLRKRGDMFIEALLELNRIPQRQNIVANRPLHNDNDISTAACSSERYSESSFTSDEEWLPEN